MKFAFYSAALGDEALDQVAAWAGSAGFDALEVDFIRHLNLANDWHSAIRSVRQQDLEVCAITLFGNLLDSNQTQRDRLREQARELAFFAVESGVPAIVLFPGRDDSLSEEENYQNLATFFQALLQEAPTVRILIENWPGPNKRYIATTPEGWRKMFQLVPGLGLEFDPSHLIWQNIDPMSAAEEFINWIFLVHGKDTEISGNPADPIRPWQYRLPGRGAMSWPDFFGVLSSGGYDGTISIEHEDADFGWPKGPVGKRKEGLSLGLKNLKHSAKQ
ncbi:MAG: sugar phosphate isomerase/epimerase [Verrucomicrobia bacterium]|nr:sugar phosphate isomerase/epimerase [Verrucomicrobiota bacterium]